MVNSLTMPKYTLATLEELTVVTISEKYEYNFNMILRDYSVIKQLQKTLLIMSKFYFNCQDLVSCGWIIFSS